MIKEIKVISYIKLYKVIKRIMQTRFINYVHLPNENGKQKSLK